MHVFLRGWMLDSIKIITLFVFAKIYLLKSKHGQNCENVRRERPPSEDYAAFLEQLCSWFMIYLTYSLLHEGGCDWMMTGVSDHSQVISIQHCCCCISQSRNGTTENTYGTQKLSQIYGTSQLIRDGWQPYCKRCFVLIYWRVYSKMNSLLVCCSLHRTDAERGDTEKSR